MDKFTPLLAKEFSRREEHIENILRLLDEGNTIKPECADVLHSLTDAARQIQVPATGSCRCTRTRRSRSR